VEADRVLRRSPTQLFFHRRVTHDAAATHLDQAGVVRRGHVHKADFGADRIDLQLSIRSSPRGRVVHVLQDLDKELHARTAPCDIADDVQFQLLASIRAMLRHVSDRKSDNAQVSVANRPKSLRAPNAPRGTNHGLQPRLIDVTHAKRPPFVHQSIKIRLVRVHGGVLGNVER
jgi:hypothetical protein